LTPGAATNMDCTMTETVPAPQGPSPAADASATAKPVKPAKKDENFFVFLAKLVLIVVVFRSFIFAPFNIPSESMLPRLENGDYLLAAKWPYGFSSYSLPFSAPLIPGRLLANQPKRGDVVIFKAPPANDQDYIKRVIGLPGDQIQMIDGQLHINGKPVPKVRVADFEIAVSTNTHCYQGLTGVQDFARTRPNGERFCSYPRFKETLPGGKSYFVIDFGAADAKNLAGVDPDNTAPVIVPEGSLFLMGDNRDNSMDSRFPAMPGGGIGIVPQTNLVGKATIVMFSTDGSAEWIKPWTWFSAARWNRIGGTF
jgi:signal peptidase I